MKLVHAADMRVPTLSGHVIEFTAGVPQDVPNVVVHDCLGKGAVPYVEDGAPEPDLAALKPVAVSTVSDHERLVGVLKDIVARGLKEEFRQDDTPKASVVKKLFGRDPTEEERAKAWLEATTKVAAE